MTNTNELETPEDKLNAIRQQIAIYQQQAKELEDQIAHDSKEARQRFVKTYQELADFARTVDGLSVKLDEQKDIAITYTKDDKQIFKQFYRYNDFPEKTVDNVKEELTTAIATIDQLHGKVAFKDTYKPKALFNPFWLTDEGILVSFDKQENNTIAVKAEKAKHTYTDGFVVTLNDTTTLKTYYNVDDDCVSQIICDTRVMIDFSQLYPLLEDMIQNINNWQTKTTIV